MIDKDKRYRTPKGEIVKGAELVEVPQTAEEIVWGVMKRTSKGTWTQRAQAAVTALREAGYDLDNPKAQPDPDGWIKHDGGPCPLHPNVRAHAEFNDGGPPAVNRAGLFNWGAVTHYRVVGA